MRVEDIASAVIAAFSPRMGPRVETCPHRIAARLVYERSRWASAIRNSRQERRDHAAELACLIDVLGSGGAADQLLACRHD